MGLDPENVRVKSRSTTTKPSSHKNDNVNFFCRFVGIFSNKTFEYELLQNPNIISVLEKLVESDFVRVNENNTGQTQTIGFAFIFVKNKGGFVFSA